MEKGKEEEGVEKEVLESLFRMQIQGGSTNGFRYHAFGVK